MMWTSQYLFICGYLLYMKIKGYANKQRNMGKWWKNEEKLSFVMLCWM